MTDRSVYYRLTDAGWSRHIVPHVSRPWPDSRRPVDTAPRVGIYDNARKLAEIKAEMRRMGLIEAD